MEPRLLGDYRLIESLGEHPSETTWMAEQASVQRPVVVVELTDLSQRAAFLARVRAKASVDHPLIGSVYEAVSEDDLCFVAMERLPGSTLAERLAMGEAMRPSEFAHLLRRLAEAMLYLQGRGMATEPLTPTAVHVDRQGVVRVENLALDGESVPEATAKDIARLGEALPPLVADGHPGASRILTVLAWMRGEGIERTLSWEEVRSYGEQIEGQLVEPVVAAGAPVTARARPARSPFPAILGGIVGVALIGGAAALLMNRPPVEPPPVKIGLPPPVSIGAGEHPSPDGGTERLPAFRISACEVTIGEYESFLRVLEHLEPGERDLFDHEGQPADKQGHQPDEWAAMLEAARVGGTWNGRPMDLNCPVVGIDWWDAVAYCDWKGGRLPTQEEWFAALRTKLEKPEFLQPAAWGPVTAIGMKDRTPHGLRGMAGSVAEWTRRPAVNPANPLGARLHVIIGASFAKPSNGALARQWTKDRELRRDDLGFRIVLPAEAE